MKKFRITRSMCSRLAAFVAGSVVTLAPFDFSKFIESGETWHVWLGVLDVSIFWVALYWSHCWAQRK